MGGRAIFSMMLCAAMPATPLLAQDRSFCAERQGMGTPTCTLDGGQVMLEVTLLGFDDVSDPLVATNGQTFGDLLLRIGIDDNTEIQLGQTSYIRVTAHDRASGLRSRAEGVGDSYFAVRRSLSDFGPLGAVEGFVTLPTGDDAVSAGTWGAGIVLPVDLPSPNRFPIALTAQIAATPSADGLGRHLSYGAILGVSHEAARDLTLALETSAFQDDEPTGPTFTTGVAGSLGWQATDRLQFNAEVIVGLIQPAPRFLVMGGFALRL